MDVKKSINEFLEGNGKNRGRKPDERYASFDFCYNYFYSFYKKNILFELANKENFQMSCLQIGFYLASWGMMRGSSFLLEKSVKNFKDLIVAISKMDRKLWKIDIEDYNKENISILLNCKKKIIKALDKNNKKISDTLVTKIMLGVFANISAYDGNFKNFMKKNNYCQTFNQKSLNQIKMFYKKTKRFLIPLKYIPLIF